ncbi:MAG TPA: hypothetical protein VIV10_09625 [Gemmatimonadales bacterium]
MLQCPLEMPGGHLILHHDGHTLLLATGSPVSMGRRPTYRFLDREIPVLRRYQGMSMEQWSESVGVNVDALLGCDVLGRHAVTIDPEAGDVVFDEAPPRPSSGVAQLGTVAGMPVVEVGLAGRKLRALFHTGATPSCLREVDTRMQRCVGMARDCYPGLGEFTTVLRAVTLTLGDREVSLECGLLPPAVEQALRPVDVHGIVGTDLLRAFAVGWGPGFSELRLVARPLTAPVRMARLEVVH